MMMPSAVAHILYSRHSPYWSPSKFLLHMNMLKLLFSLLCLRTTNIWSLTVLKTLHQLWTLDVVFDIVSWDFRVNCKKRRSMICEWKCFSLKCNRLRIVITSRRCQVNCFANVMNVEDCWRLFCFTKWKFERFTEMTFLFSVGWQPKSRTSEY